ncbi:MAG: sulfatase [Planctomycetota bacterium]|nr:sulfatase [Planctomycetota bacterium]
MSTSVEAWAGRRAGWAALVGLLLAAGCGGQAAPPAVLRVTRDTTRADRLGCYGRADAGTPAIDALAARGLRVERAISPVPLTMPSHTTMMTGLEPVAHGVRDNGLFVLDPAHDTLAEELTGLGYRSGAFVSAYPLSKSFGLDQGFEVYDDQLGMTGPGGADAVGAMHERRGDVTVDRALRWLDTVAEDESFFAWVHLFDPHYPLAAPEPFASRYPSDLYQAEVSFADSQVARLFAWLEESGRADTTLVVLTSDHGEGLGEHDEVSHGNLLYDGTQRVPLVLAGPGVASGVVLPGPVGLVDVAATMRAFAGIEVRGLGAAIDLAGGGHGGTAYMETVFPRIHFGWSELYGIERDGWKYVEAPGAGGAAELRRVGADGEGADVLAEEAELGARLAADLAKLRAKLAATALGVGAAAAPSAGALEALEALGYVGADASAVASLDSGIEGLDPRRVIGASRAANLLRTVVAMGDLDAAETQLATIETLDPGGILHLESRGFLELARGLQGGRDGVALERARESFEAAVRLSPGRRGLWQKLAEVNLALDEPEAAFAAASHAAGLAPPPKDLVELVSTLELRLDHERQQAVARGDADRVRRIDALLAE